MITLFARRLTGSAEGFRRHGHGKRVDQIDKVVTGDYFNLMQAVNIKELKSRLSAYLRQVRAGETFLVTDRNQVVARLGPVGLQVGVPAESESVLRLAAIGARPPLRARRPTDYARPGEPSGLSAAQISSLLDWTRGEG